MSYNKLASNFFAALSIICIIMGGVLHSVGAGLAIASMLCFVTAFVLYCRK